jgi:hypothetical protein
MTVVLSGFANPLRHADDTKVAVKQRALGGHAQYGYNAINKGDFIEDCLSAESASSADVYVDE